QQLERISFVKMPRLVGGDTMPAAHLAGHEEEVDHRERGSVCASVAGPHQGLRSMNLTKVSALGVRRQVQVGYELRRAGMHRTRGPTVSAVQEATSAVPPT